MAGDRLTRFSPFKLPCCNGEDGKHFSHDLHRDVCHFCCWWGIGISLEASKEVSNTLKQLSECALAIHNTLSRLTEKGVTMAYVKEPRKSLTDRRTPMPVKITPAGGYIYKINIRAKILNDHSSPETYRTDTCADG